MANAMDCETLLTIKREFLLKRDDSGEELNGELELSLDLSLGGSIGKAKEKKKENPRCPPGNLQPCLKKFASGSLNKDGEESKDKGDAGMDVDVGKGKAATQEIWKNLHHGNPSIAVSAPPPLSRSLSGAGTFEALVLPNKAAWPHQLINTNSPNMIRNGTGHHRILRTCSVGALGAGFMAPPPSSGLHKQPSLDLLLPNRKQEGVQSTMQKEILEKQRKREVHAMRRQEARKKREEKQQKKARREEGKSFLENRTSISFPISSTSIPSSNKWMLHPEPSITQTNQTQMDLKEGKLVLETQRSLHRVRDRAVKENEPWIDMEKRIKKKGSRNGSLDSLPYDFSRRTKHVASDPSETSKFMEKKANCNHSVSARNSNSPIRGDSGSEDCENERKNSSSNGDEGGNTSPRSQSTNCEASGPYPAPAFPVLPLPYPLPMTGANAHCMPLPIGFSFPYVLPCWPPSAQSTGSDSSKSNVPLVSNVSQSVSTHGLPPFQMPIPGALPNWISLPQGKGSPALVSGPEQNSHAPGVPLRRSSSAIPDQDSKSSEGTSSNDTKSRSSKSAEPSWKGFQSLTRDPSMNEAQTQVMSFSEAESAKCREILEKTTSSITEETQFHKTSQEKPLETPFKNSSHFVSDSNNKKENSSGHGTPVQISEGPNKQTTKNCTHEKSDQDNKSNLKPGMSCSQIHGGNGSLPTLHWVTTTGVGPNGTTISGILSSYSSNQVKIVCICHGTQMSPAEFVQHAGSTDISNPERNIVVTPIPIGIPTTSAQG